MSDDPAHRAALARAEAAWARHPPPEPIRLPDTGERAWFIVRSRHHQERDADDALHQLGCDTFLPMLKKDIVHRNSRRVVTRSFVLFARYLFAELPLNPRAWALLASLEPVESVLGADGPTPIRASVVERFKLAAEQGAFDETLEARRRRGEVNPTAGVLYPRGTRVRIIAGPLHGYYALVINPRGRQAVRAMIETIRHATPVTLPIDMIQREAPP